MTMTGNATGPDTAAELTALAGWIDEQLGDETADRQWIAESAAARVRDITLQMLGGAALAAGRGLSPAGLGTLRAALADALAHREPGGYCRDCEAHPAGLCEDHPADLGKADAYRVLARGLGIEVER